MKKIILSSSNALLTRTLYASLRDDGHDVEIVEHPATAVQKIMHQAYDLCIIDSEPFGLSENDAAEIIRNVAPHTAILFVDPGTAVHEAGKAPMDLEIFKRTIRSIAV